MHQEIYEELKRVAREEKTITYSEIAPLAGLDMELAEDRNSIAEILDEISRHEHDQGRPLLSAVVVHAEGGESGGIPGQGFFTLAKSLGLFRGGDKVVFFALELGRVHKAWKS